MKYIKGICYTNLDGYEGEVWPFYFVAVPRVGERVVSKSGKQLYVANLEYHQADKEIFLFGFNLKLVPYEPYIKIELNKPRLS